jgi:glycosyltransferase involved in cell wall biosynthesis
MRILFVSHFYPPESTTGVELYTHTIAKAMLARNHTVQVICATGWERGAQHSNGFVEEELDQVPVRRFALNWKLAPRPFDYLFRNPLIAGYVQSLLESWKPGLIHITSCYSLSASVIEIAKELGIPIVLQLHDYWFICARHDLLRWDATLCSGPESPALCQRCMLNHAKIYRLPRKLFSERITLSFIAGLARTGPLTRLRGLRGMVGDFKLRRSYLLEMMAQCDVVIAPSHFLQKMYEQNGVPPGRIQFLSHGCDLECLGHITRKTSNCLRFGYIGKLSYMKGVHIIVQAFAQIEPGEAELHIYGPLEPGSYLSELQQQSNGTTNIIFHGRFERHQEAEILSTIDVLVVPSLWYENSPFVVREAFASGIPVIVSGHGGLLEMVNDGHDGLCFEPGNVDDLARKILCLIKEPDLLEHLRAGIGPVKTIDEEVDELEMTYKKLTMQSYLAGR